MLVIEWPTISWRSLSSDTKEQYTWIDFTTEFEKTYATPSDEAAHHFNFKINLAAVHAHNNARTFNSWKAGVNHYTDLDKKEMSVHKGLAPAIRGSVQNTDTEPMMLISQRASDGSDLRALDPSGPASLDWRTEGVITPVKNQEGCGACWAFAAVECIESSLAIATKEPPLVLSPQEIVNCTPNPNSCGGAGGCSGSVSALAYAYAMMNGRRHL